MRRFVLVSCLAMGGVLLSSGCRTLTPTPAAFGEESWRAMHFLNYHSDADLERLGAQLPALARAGVNVVILEVDYSFEYESHPELRYGAAPITREGARRFAQRCHDNGLRLAVEFQSLGHQSWAEETYPLLIEYPHLDLTPGAFPGNEGIYCREWDPTNPQVYEIVFALLDELIEAFEPFAVHVGMDEVFLLGNPASPSTVGKDPGQLYAQAVNDLYGHIVTTHGLQMMMWGDRLIDAAVCDYGEWESSTNGTHTAVNAIPTDIIICDWHYEKRATYPSIPYFTDRGFSVLPTSWREVSAAKALTRYSLRLGNDKALGHLFTKWSQYDDPASYPPLRKCMRYLRPRE